MGVLIGGAVFPTAFAVTWKGQSRAGAIAGSLSSLAAGITAWLLVARFHYGELTLSSTGSNYPTLAGNLAAMMTSLVVSVTISLVKPQNFDWNIARSMNPVETDDETSKSQNLTGRQPEHVADGNFNETPATQGDAIPEKYIDENSTAHDPGLDAIRAEEEAEQAQAEMIEEDHTRLQHALKLAYLASIILPLVMDFIIPIPMFLSHYVFSKGFYRMGCDWFRLGFCIDCYQHSSASMGNQRIFQTLVKHLYGQVLSDITGRHRS